MDGDPANQHLFPIAVEVEAGKTYTWCGCFDSKTQPLCDKKDCGAKALTFVASVTEDAYLCNCKQTKNPPWCDGSHSKLLMEAIKNRQK